MTAPAHSADLVLKRAVLGTGGVGYFEYEATVTGKETLTLRSRLDQVDDILKSMIILDPAGTGSATLPGKAGADEAFNALPFSRSDLDSMASLMTALKGAEIKVAAPRSIAGRIASVQPEQVTDKDGRTITRTRVSVFSGASMDQFILEDAQGLEFADTRLGEQVTGALTALRSAQDRSGRDISIHLADGAQRTVRIGYVAEAPVWKTAYRLTLPKAGEDKAQLQGWVVLENMTGDAWKDVAVTLSSAAPVTFRQALYDPYYVSRQTIAPPVSQAALPRTDQGQVALGGAGYAEIAVPAAPEQQRIMRSRKIEAVQDGMVQQTETAPPASTEENAAGASFTLSVPVSVGSGESLTIPFVDQKVPAEAVAWYQGGGRNPWQGMTLKNDGSTSLPAGSATIYEATDAGPLFSGEAQFPLLPAGDSRLVGFGAEQKILVDRENRTASAVTKVKSVNGALQIESKLRETTLYRVKNIAAEARRMVIEQPRAQDWRLVQPKAEEATLAGSAYRMRFEVEPGKTREFPVVMERPVVETVAIQELTAERILALIASTELDAESKARLAAIAEAARASDEASQVLASRQERRDGITADQERIRENIGAAPEGSDLARLYAQKMLDQERALEQLDKDIVDARTKYEEARRVLGDRVRAF
ncbi:DUF4139 domain-containing protein [Mesorhizobium sp. Pch-S]|uniref:DUF4139 domain-containing protein n=1 Tax=Mesorhizobium sp. Pch-S TaxID=2082387 RepID=UPI0013EC524C|nr:DUF4139 domain-containing protein [Mesorhizobium sp. Pch-S]